MEAHRKPFHAEWLAQKTLFDFNDMPVQQKDVRQYLLEKYARYLDTMAANERQSPRISPEMFYKATSLNGDVYFLRLLGQLYQKTVDVAAEKETKTIVTAQAPYLDYVYTSEDSAAQWADIRKRIRIMFDNHKGGICANLSVGYFNAIFASPYVLIVTVESELAERPDERWPIAFLIMTRDEGNYWTVPMVCSHPAGSVFPYLFARALGYLQRRKLIKVGNMIRLEAANSKLVQYYAMELQFVPDTNDIEDLQLFYRALSDHEQVRAYLEQHRSELQNSVSQAWKMRVQYTTHYFRYVQVNASRRFAGWDALFDGDGSHQIALVHNPLCEQCQVREARFQEDTADNPPLFFCSNQCQKDHYTQGL